MNAPQAHEHSPFAAGYIALAAKHDEVIALLQNSGTSTYETFIKLPADKADYAYAEGKWTIKQMLGHMIDTERVFSYRAYCISRGDQSAFPGFDQENYLKVNNYSNRTLESLAHEFKAVREANLYFINALTDDQIAMMGTASNHPVSVKALLYMMAGHEVHHLNILQERYL